MNIRLTSALLLVYMLIQLAGNYANAVGVFESSKTVSMPVTFLINSEQQGDVENTAEHKSVMQNCSQCVDGTHCLFSNCPMLPSSLKVPTRVSGPPEVILFGHTQTPDRYLENLFRPPIFS